MSVFCVIFKVSFSESCLAVVKNVQDLCVFYCFVTGFCGLEQ